MADEADVILSPSTGLILTTLQRIKQRSLPGQKAKTAVRDRIERAAVRYERLIVLISGNRIEDSRGSKSSSEAIMLDERDCEAFVDFNAFCLSTQDDTQVIFTSGDVQNLAKWVVALMIKYGHANAQMRLLQDETLWEIFLRRAGMNAFAAQAILARLKKPENDVNETHSDGSAMEFGLTAFIRMSPRERGDRFGVLLGGYRVLERVSKVLDAQW